MVRVQKKIEVLALVEIVEDQEEQEHLKDFLQLKELVQLAVVLDKLLQTHALFATVRGELENKEILK